MRTMARFVCVTLLTIASSVQAQSGLPPGTWRIADAPPELRPPATEGDLIVISLQDTLLRELSRTLEAGGPPLAVRSCHVDVVGVIQRLGRSGDITAGRTSDRVRNPANAPKPWAASLVAANAGRQVKDVDGYVVDLGDRVGLLRPIAHRPLCASCHGRPETFAPEVQRALKERYPADRAVGFAEGEVRGWFWVELPKRQR
jgi:hypothetical protein